MRNSLLCLLLIIYIVNATICYKYSDCSSLKQQSCFTNNSTCVGGTNNGQQCTSSAICGGGVCETNGFCVSTSSGILPCVHNQDCPSYMFCSLGYRVCLNSGNPCVGGFECATSGCNNNPNLCICSPGVCRAKYPPPPTSSPTPPPICPCVNGTNGIDGINGTDGTNGLNGTNGIDGLNGTNGIDGINGTDGLNGTNGLNGTSGLNGTDGSNGTCDPISCCGTDIPTTNVQMVVTNQPGNQSVPSYVTIQISNGGVSFGNPQLYPGWCGDTNTHINVGPCYTSRIYSFFDPNIKNILLGYGYNILVNNINKVNYILSQSNVVMFLSFFSFSYCDIQTAIWQLLVGPGTTDPSCPANQADVDVILADAIANGENYRPINPGDYYGFFVVPFNICPNNETTTIFQLMIIMGNVSQFPLPCAWTNWGGLFSCCTNDTKIVPVVSNYTVTAGDYFIQINSSAVTTVQLPSPVWKQDLFIKDVTGSASINNKIILPYLGSLIDGSLSYVINTNYGGVTLISDGSNYWVQNKL